MKISIDVERRPLGPELHELAAEWDELLRRSSCPTIYSTLDYIEISCKHYALDEEVFFLFFREAASARLLAIFPMSLWKKKLYGITVRTLEHGVTTMWTDIDKPYPIIDRDHEPDCWRRFQEYFHREYCGWDVIQYDELISCSALLSGLKELFPFPAYWTKVKTGPESPIVRLDGDWEQFWKTHANLRRKDRRLVAQIGDRFAYRVTGDPADMERCTDEYMATEQAGWKAKTGISNPEPQKFHRELIARLAAKGQVFFGNMYDGDKVISAEISYVFADRVFFALGTYHPDYAKLSPGAVSTGRFIEYFHGKGYTEGDFLAGFAHYIYPWASRIQTTRNIAIRRMNWKGWYLAACHLVSIKLVRPLRLAMQKRASGPPPPAAPAPRP